MSGVGTPAMSYQMRSHPAIGQVHQVESWYTRRKGEIGNADIVSVANAAVSLQGIKRTREQTRIDLPVDTVRAPESEPSPRGNRREAGKREIDKKAAGNDQDDELQHN
jgi:hypothetical protein